MADWCWETFDNVKRVNSLVDGFPFTILKGRIPGNCRVRRLYETVAITSCPHVNEGFVEKFSIRIEDVAVFFFLEELLLASSNVRNNGIEVVVRVPK